MLAGTYANPTSTLQVISDGGSITITNLATGQTMNCFHLLPSIVTSAPTSVPAKCTTMATKLPV